MKKLALGVAALLVTAGGSVATAAPSSKDGGDWCEEHSDANARPEVDKERPVAAGGGSRDGSQKNAFACSDTKAEAADREVYQGFVVNAWVDNENGNLRVNCVPQKGSVYEERCNRIVRLPARVTAAAPAVDVTAPSARERGRVSVGDDGDDPVLTVDSDRLDAGLDLAHACVELDRSPWCGENLGGQ